MIGIPTLLANGNFEVYHQLVVENKEGVALANVSAVKDLKAQFGPEFFIQVSDLALVTPPTNADSSITLNVLGWDGTAATNLIDQAVTTNVLASDDSFEIGFKVEIDALATKGVLEKKTTVAGTAINNTKASLTDAAGNKLTASDDSGSDADPRNLTLSIDSTEPDEPAPRSVPSLSLTKTSGDAFANGDNWDVTFTLALENNGTLAINRVEIFDDLAASFGGQFAGVTLDRVTAGSENTGSALIANPRFTRDTLRSLVSSTGPVNVGDTFEVVFTVTIDPNVGGTAASGLESQSNAVCEAVDENGDTITNLVKSSSTAQKAGNKVSSRATAIVSEPKPIVKPDIAVAKSVARGPLPLASGNFGVTYELVVANAGNVDLAELTLVEDLAGQFGSVLLRAGKVALASPPSHARSRVKLDGAWNGDGATELVNQTASPRLAVGDSFTVEFTVEVDPTAVGGPNSLENQVVVTGKPVEVINENLLSSNDDVVLATEISNDTGADHDRDNLVAEVDQESSGDTAPSLADLVIKKAIVSNDTGADLNSDSLSVEVDQESRDDTAPSLADLAIKKAIVSNDTGADLNSDNLTAEVDQESSDDTAPSLSDLAIKKAIAGDPVKTNRGNYVVTYQLLIENTGNVDLANLSLLEDLLTLFGPPLIKAGNLTIASGPSDAGSSVSVDSVGWNGKTGTELLDSLAANILVSGDAFTIQFEVELNPKRIISPQEKQAYPSLLPGFHSAKLTPIGDLITSFIGAPGPIYSGIPIDRNPSPSGLDSETRVPSRYSVGDGSIMAAV